jgi:hypothetical protein
VDLEIWKLSTFKKKTSRRVVKNFKNKMVTWRSMCFFGRSKSENLQIFYTFLWWSDKMKDKLFSAWQFLNEIHVTPHLNIVTCIYLSMSLRTYCSFLDNAENFEFLELFAVWNSVKFLHHLAIKCVFVVTWVHSERRMPNPILNK